ncbi:Kelch domain-containing protein 4 [Armadillidium nasatum]|uniref:Kelch domain-containing protein 4 n=1 Tax=Armadillidium nasatum TaxID=96803 RepID=A0A5N5SWK9_9CRUS|nr:Kelch domain-containing protein 4 [Armadillidium nasatum]
MGKKDKKKGKGAEKTAAKTEKKLNQKLKKELALKGEENIENLLAKFVEEDKKKNSVIEELVSPPSKRSSFSLIAHPDKDQLILFGGEYFNGNKTFVYNDLYFYNIKQDRWIKVTSPGGPPPRSSHQAATFSQAGGQMWIFGGEFMSPTQSQFYHYKDLWVFHFSSKKWEKVVGNGNGPSSRSGHRMIGLKKQLIIFGGFHDNQRDYKYFDDVYLFNLETYSWHRLQPSGNGPCPRSGCQMMPLSEGRILIYGGYSKKKVKKDVDVGIIHSDMYILAPEKHDTTGLKWKWISVKQSGIRPSPRCAFSMTLNSSEKALMFGGVYDTEDNEEDLEGIFYDELYQLDLNKFSWHEVQVTGKRDEEEKKRRRKVKEEEDMEEGEEENKVDSKLEDLNLEGKDRIVSDDGVFTVTVGPSSKSPLEDEL